MIAGRRSVVELVDHAEVLSLGRIREVQDAPRIGVSGAGPRHVYRGVDRLFGPQVDGAVPQIAGGKQPVRADLFLHAQVPLLKIGDMEVQRVRRVGAECRERRVLGQIERERVAAGIVGPWIRQRNGGQIDHGRPRRSLRETIREQRVRHVVQDPPG